MFSTFKYDPETREVQELRSAFDPVTARSSQHQACNTCHAKKLRCSGEKSGCERCAASKLLCEYTRSNSSRRGKKSSGRSSTDSRSGDVGGGDSSPGSQSGKSSRHHRQSRHSSKHASKVSPTRSCRQEDDSNSALGQFDPSTLGPEDGFDLSSLSVGNQGGNIMGSTGEEYPAFTANAGDYYGQAAGGWPISSSQAGYIGTSAGVDLSTAGQTPYGEGDYYANYQDYTPYHHQQHDPRYWPQG